MKRRTFIKGTLPLALTPFFVESLVARNVSKMLGLNLVPGDFKDRKLIILNMFGGNDGLNCVVPMDQHALYISPTIRPTIGLVQSALIPLDSTVPSNQQVGLHPQLEELKILYDEGKMNLMQSVGYPSPNYSHFRSDALIWGVKDGTFADDIRMGWLANYLDKVHPAFSDRPTTQYPSPLGIQIGATSKNKGYEHEIFNNIGVNINNLARNTLYGQLKAPLSTDSDYGKLLQYLKQVEEDSMLYRHNVVDSFNKGVNYNGSAAYPNSDLGKQLKTIARLINGGIDSKVLLAYRGGWDTHNGQVEEGNTHVGYHANILNDVAQSIFAFQRDLEAQGIDDKVVLLTISEFGRTIVENSNFGTDHDSLSPWFIIGTPVKAGITGRNLDLTKLLGRKTADDLQHDYRRIFATILQDWFGHTDNLLNQVGLGEFVGEEGTPNGKLDIFDDDEVVPEPLLVDDFSELFIDEFDLVEIKTEDGWTYYGRNPDDSVYIFAIEHKPLEGNTLDFTPLITINDLLDDGYGKDYYELIDGDKGNYVFGKMWNMLINTGSINGFVNMRFFINSFRLEHLNTLATDFKNTNIHNELSSALWVKTVDDVLIPTTDLKARGFNKGIESVGAVNQGVYEYQNYFQFDNVTNFDNRGGAICHIVTNELSGFDAFAEPGTIIYLESGKLWGYNGNNWVKLNF